MASPATVTGETPISASGRTIISWHIFSVSVMPSSISCAGSGVGVGVGSGVGVGVGVGPGVLVEAGCEGAIVTRAGASADAPQAVSSSMSKSSVIDHTFFIFC